MREIFLENDAEKIFFAQVILKIAGLMVKKKTLKNFCRCLSFVLFTLK